MQDPFCSEQWEELCRRLRRTADYYSESSEELGKRFSPDVEEYVRQDPPKNYSEFLDRVRQAAVLASTWKERTSVEMTSQAQS